MCVRLTFRSSSWQTQQDETRCENGRRLSNRSKRASSLSPLSFGRSAWTVLARRKKDKNDTIMTATHVTRQKRMPRKRSIHLPMAEELKIKHELCSLRANAVIVCRNGKLIDKCIDIFFLQILGQLQFNGHPSFIIDQIPDTFTQNGIYYRSDLTLSSSVTTRQSSNKFGFALAAPSLRPECAKWNRSQSLF